MLIQKRKISYYIFAGIFAGIATAVKYNGAIALPFLFLIHTYTTFQDHKEEPLTKKIAATFLSLPLLLSIIFWGIFFYALEPILWHNLKTGLQYIRAYLDVAAFVGIPRQFYGHSLKTLIYNIECMPRNLWMFFRCVSLLVITLSLLGIILSTQKRKAYILIAFPIIILLFLFLTKSLFGEEYLLHPLPFIYILGGLGCHTLLNLSRRSHFNKIAVFYIVIPFVVLYSLYVGFRETKYAAIGNIRYYANEWAAKNLKGQCINYLPYTLLPRYNFCTRKASIFVVPSPETYKRNYRLPKGSMLLKTFQVEKTKPLLHHLRGHQIRFFAYKGKNFTSQPHIPIIPTPNPHTLRRYTVRFLNGINFDPGYCKFSLVPQFQHIFKLISFQTLKNIKILVKNSNVVNVVKILDRTYKFLPFEEKILHLPVSRCFPWVYPYIYVLPMKSLNDVLINIQPSHNALVGAFVKKELESNRMNFWPFGKNSFIKTYKSIYLYDFKCLKNLLFKTVPLDLLERIDTTTDFYHKKNKDDFCLFYKAPVFLEKGIYSCNIMSHLCLKKRSKLTFKVITPSRILSEKIVTKDTLKKMHTANGCLDRYLIQLHFKTSSWCLTHVLIEAEGNCKIKVDEISFKTDMKSLLRERIETEAINYFLKHDKKLDPLFLEKLDPDKLNFRQDFNIATSLYKNRLIEKALMWYKSAHKKNPISITCASRIMEISHLQGNLQEEECFKNILNKLASLEYGPWRFETGFSLNAISISHKTFKTNSIPFILYLTLPNISGDQAVSITLKNRKDSFEKSISLLKSKSLGDIYTIKGKIDLPVNVPSGTYDVFFTFKIPKVDYKYRILSHGNPLEKREIKISQICILTAALLKVK
jgi:hypothetical protein